LATPTTQNITTPWTLDKIIRILHVDDDVAFLQNAQRILGANREFDVESVTSVSEARSKLNFGKFDVILSDYQMPQKNGLDFLTELRNSGILTPFILVSEKDKSEVIAKALNLGVFRYIDKHSDQQKLSTQLFEAIQQAYTQAPKMGLLGNTDFLRALYENSPTGIIIVKAATQRIVAANNAALIVLGITKDHLIGKVCQAAICSAPNGVCPIIDLNHTINNEEQVLVRMNSRQIRILKTASRVVVSGEEYIVESIIDLSKRRAEEQENKEKAREYGVLFSENPQAIVLCDKYFKVIEVNPSFKSLFRCSAENVKGQDAIDLFTPENLKIENNWIKQRLLEGHIECQTKRLGTDHSTINVSLYGAAICLDGNITGFVLIFQDSTEVVAAREELTRMIDEQNMSLGKTRLLNEQLSVTNGLTRHDIRNKLTALTFKAYIAKKHSKENLEVVSYLTDIETISNNIARLLEFAKTYEMLGTEEQSYINVGKMVAEAVSLFVDLKGVTVINECLDFEVKANSMLLELFHNMVDNSLKYGTPKITEIKVHAEINQEGSTELIYEDNGNGINPEIKARLFEKGVTTKGTGYGLWLIRRICEMYGWSVQETGVFGQGVRFVMKIPNNISNSTLLQLSSNMLEVER
jgi:PAS domain S-box-containing protein